MIIKSIIIATVIAIFLYSEETNAKILEANTCTIGLPPLSYTAFDPIEKKNIISAFGKKGFYVTEMKSENEILNQEFYSDVSVECSKTYFATQAQTRIRIVESSTAKIVAKHTNPIFADIFHCKVEILKAIMALPMCKIK